MVGRQAGNELREAVACLTHAAPPPWHNADPKPASDAAVDVAVAVVALASLVYVFEPSYIA